jgi:hypothetical protein
MGKVLWGALWFLLERVRAQALFAFDVPDLYVWLLFLLMMMYETGVEQGRRGRCAK